ncbi:MAG: hypothetical protein IJJ67_03055 [Oscillospiraceae bacterium]|nr:hypothetical protein [Oscillospiraceae bacterium]
MKKGTVVRIAEKWRDQSETEHGIALEQIKYTGSSYDKLEELIMGIVKKYGCE